jgi:hypothetical protein
MLALSGEMIGSLLVQMISPRGFEFHPRARL